MSTIGTPFTTTAKRALLCGSGELGKEVVIELQRLGVEVIALDSYANAPEILKNILKSWLETPFEGGRHERRVQKISSLTSSHS